MKQIKEFLFGRRTQPVCQIKTTYYTVHPTSRPSQWDWMKEYRVGMLYDRKITHLN